MPGGEKPVLVPEAEYMTPVGAMQQACSNDIEEMAKCGNILYDIKYEFSNAGCATGWFKASRQAKRPIEGKQYYRF